MLAVQFQKVEGGAVCPALHGNDYTGLRFSKKFPAPFVKSLNLAVFVDVAYTTRTDTSRGQIGDMCYESH